MTSIESEANGKNKSILFAICCHNLLSCPCVFKVALFETPFPCPQTSRHAHDFIHDIKKSALLRGDISKV